MPHVANPGLALNAGAVLLATFVLPIMLAGTSALAQNTNSFAPDQIKRGAALYATNCESCHGVKMVGPEWASDLQKFPKDQSARFVDSVTNGVRNMPPWGDVLKRDEIEALWAYVVAGEKKD
jgi:mono/diheme cytochrome c family protein